MSWPVTTAYGIETYYCPRCNEPEPDGLPNVEAFETFGELCCDECAASLLEEAIDTENFERGII